MLKDKKESAIKLRHKGTSINEIAISLGVAKSSVSAWVRNVELSDAQILSLKNNKHRLDIVEKRRKTRLVNELAKRNKIISKAEKQIEKLTNKELWLVGTMLYWAEGGKTQRGLIRFSNGDPEMIKIMMAFFRIICKVPEEKFRGHIHIHSHLDHLRAKNYWANITQISSDKFFKTYRKINVSSKGKKDTLPYGVMDIYICDTQLFLKIIGWVKGVFKAY